MSDFTLNIFTLNCWGIPVVSKNRIERIEAIAKYLIQSNHNIVCLQEIWSEKDYTTLKESLNIVLPYSYYFYSGVLGSGLCIFSKWVIQDVFFHQWPLNGYIHKIHHGDWFGGKGVGLCRIKYGQKLINVYCTHVTLSYRLITLIPSLFDPFDLHCQKANPNIKAPSGTCDNANNSYTDLKQAERTPEGKRIDHILFHVNSLWQAQVVNFGNPLEDRVPGQVFSYSDHNAVTLELKLTASDDTDGETKTMKNDLFDATITQAINVCKEASATIIRSKKLYLTSGGLLFMFLLGTIGFWPHKVIYDIIKIFLSAFSFYYIIMGTLWNQIEMNSLKAGLNALQNFSKTRSERDYVNNSGDEAKNTLNDSKNNSHGEAKNSLDNDEVENSLKDNDVKNNVDDATKDIKYYESYIN
ncbi:hypothetical protein ACJJTC_006673 [Scirpophaga incertulas]